MRRSIAMLFVVVAMTMTVACGDSSTPDMTPTAHGSAAESRSTPATATPVLPTPTIEPTATTRAEVTSTPARIPDLPERRQILLLSDLHEWQPYVEYGVTAGPERASYRVRIDEMMTVADQNAAFFQTKRFSTKYDNVEVSMNMRLLDASDYSESCLTARADTLDSESWSAYFLCISTDGDVWFHFSEVLPDGEWQTVPLSDYEPATSIRNLGEWNTLTLVADASSFWFIVNDVLVGTAEHDGPEFGDVGMFVLAEGGPAEWEYTLLKVYQLQAQVSAVQQP